MIQMIIPKEKQYGEYDFNTPGSYNVTYVVTDSSGNETKKNMVLNVIEKAEGGGTTVPKEKLPIEEVLENYKNQNTKVGIDVSKWQGEIDWQKVKNVGVEFAIIRMGYQTDYDGEYVIDPYFKANIEGAKEAKLPIRIIFLFLC